MKSRCRINLTVEPAVLPDLDKLRGDMTRTAYVTWLLHEAIRQAKAAAKQGAGQLQASSVRP